MVPILWKDEHENLLHALKVLAESLNPIKK